MDKNNKKTKRHLGFLIQRLHDNAYTMGTLPFLFCSML